MNTATLIVPDNWVVLNEAERRRFLSEEFGDVSSSVLAVARPKDGKEGVFAVLNRLTVGYVDSAGGHIDTQTVRAKIEEDLLILNQENGVEGADEVRFKKFSPPPSYDSAQHTVTYGVELSFGRDPALNLYRIRLTRDGALLLAVVGKPSDQLSLNGFAIEPAAGQRYENFNPNADRRSESTLTNVLMMNAFI